MTDCAPSDIRAAVEAIARAEAAALGKVAAHQESRPPSSSLTGLNLASFMGSRFRETPAPLAWTFTDSLLARTVGLIVGPPGTGKSTWLVQLVAALATGRAGFLDNIFTPGLSGRVIGLFAEEDEAVLHRRVRSVFDALDPGREHWQTFEERACLIPASGWDLRLIENVSGNPAPSAVFHDLVALCRDFRPSLVILDPLSRFYGQNENDNAMATLFVSLLERIKEDAGASVLVVHHTSKGAATPGGRFSLDSALSQDALRGASGLTGAARWQMNLIALPSAQARHVIGAAEAKDGEYLAGRVSKKNYGPPEDVFFLHRGPGGVLRKQESCRTAKNKATDEALRERIKAEVARREQVGESPLTVKLLGDVFPPRWKDEISGASRAAVRAAAESLLWDGELFTVQRQNAQNRTFLYLATRPEKDREDRPEDRQVEDRQDRPEPAKNAPPLPGSRAESLSMLPEEDRPREDRPEKLAGPGTRTNQGPATGEDRPSLKRGERGRCGASLPSSK